MMIAIIITKEDLKTIQDLLQPLGKKISKFDISQMNAHSAFIYNYPELRTKNILLFGIQGQFMDVSVIINGLPAYYNLVRYDGIETLGETVGAVHDLLIPDVCEQIDAVMYFGSGLNKTIANKLQEIANQLQISEVKRLNGFRMMKTSLDEREREYCSRTFQIYPACIGGCLPTKHPILTL